VQHPVLAGATGGAHVISNGWASEVFFKSSGTGILVFEEQHEVDSTAIDELSVNNGPQRFF
jgi:hypothetical protein